MFENIIFKVPDNSQEFDNKINELTKFSYFYFTNEDYYELDKIFDSNDEKIKETIPSNYLFNIDSILQNKVYQYQLSIAARIYLVLCCNNDVKMIELHLEYLDFIKAEGKIFYLTLINEIFEKGWLSEKML